MVWAVSSLAALSWRTAVKSCSTTVYAPYRSQYSRFPFRNYCRFLLVSAMILTIRVHSWFSSTDAEVHLT
jgi:hypothetical protein